MRTMFRLLAGVTAALMMATVFAGAAAADPTPDAGTSVTFEILPGTLDISAPESAYIKKVSLDGDLTGPLGPVTATDSRGVRDASWSASVTATDFTTGDRSADETIPATQIDYWSGTATSTTGVGVFTPGQATAGDAKPLDTVAALTAFSRAAETGLSSATWDPTLTVNMNSQTVAGIYSGSLTHSVV